MATSKENRAVFAPLRDAGFRAARAGFVFEGRRALEAAAAQDPSDPRVWEILGLCSFCTGNISAARRCWQYAAARDPESPATSWLRELETGTIASGLNKYRGALEEARLGHYAVAAKTISDARAVIPDFSPGGRLEGVIFTALGDEPRARNAWGNQLRVVPDDPALNRLMTELAEPPFVAAHSRVLTRRRFRRVTPLWAAIISAIAITAVIADVSIRRGATVAEIAPSEASPAVQRTSLPLATKSALVESNATAAPANGGPQVHVSDWRAGWRLFVDGRRDFRRGALTLAVKKLSRAVLAGTGAFYHDDALYSLAQAQAKTGDVNAARVTAERLLREYPNSMFANSVTSKIARMSDKPGR